MPRYHAGFSFGTVAAAGIAAVAARPARAGRRARPGRRGRCRWSASRSPSGRSCRPSTSPRCSTRTERAEKGARGALAAWLEPRTLLIGLVVLAAALTEGSANDWVSLAVVDGFDVQDAVGALAFAVFVTAMTAMRWFGTTLLDRYGRVAVLRLCAGLSLVGLLIFALAGPLWLALVGIVRVGRRAPRSASRSA